ncbi:MAG TPA: GNAT family N-acetyltransferase [Oligoflexus sp.]|uniref:GNAT family N-acetyltransferase n=1 Tax=Oligoflexus sp. TaxID=1971216 RepID=UPI002D36B517|nr:GNAT family N-acetyltransferase [Oligoflexus sp.]HYX32290.1 GNAT family N-acetyltransferase [Oligoflexus sp.]
MPLDYVVRPAQMQEAELLSDFQVTMAMESEGLRLDRPTVLRGIQSFLQRPDEGAYYVVTHDNIPVGCAMVQHEWSDWRARHVLWLHSVYVVPKFRRSGVFRTLYAFLQKQVQATPDLAGIRLYVDQKNTQAEATYRRLGMTDEHYKLFEWLKSEG